MPEQDLVGRVVFKEPFADDLELIALPFAINLVELRRQFPKTPHGSDVRGPERQPNQFSLGLPRPGALRRQVSTACHADVTTSAILRIPERT